MDRILEAKQDQQNGITNQTHVQQNRDFNTWEKYLERCGITDIFLDDFNTESRLLLMSGYTATGGRTRKRKLLGKTVRAAIGHICLTFRESFQANPALEQSGQRSILLHRQIKGYIHEGPKKPSPNEFS